MPSRPPFQSLAQAHRLGRQAPVICPGVDWRDIREMGNALRHDYDELLHEVLWNTIVNALPPLKAAVKTAMERIAKAPGSSNQ